MAPRVLVADDVEINQLLMRSSLIAAGYRVAIAADGAEAVAMVAGAGDDPFALVMMDLQMPIVDGYQASRQLRAAGLDRERLPIVALTASRDAAIDRACDEAGIDEVLSKPISPRHLAELVDRYCRPHGQATDQQPVAETNGFQANPRASLRAIQRQRKLRLKTLIRSLHGMTEPSAADRDEFFDLLHKLAGSAAYLGEASLGVAAAAIEQKFRASGNFAPTLDHAAISLLPLLAEPGTEDDQPWRG